LAQDNDKNHRYNQRKKDDSAYIEELHIPVSQYLMNIIHLMSGKISEENIRKLRKIVYSIDNGHLTRKNVVFGASDEIFAIATIHNNDIVFYKGFQILFERIKIDLKDLTIDIKDAISLSFMFEKNKMLILMGTGEKGSININGSTINVQFNEFGPIGEYILTTEYDISKSKLYSVAKLSKDYMIIDNVVYYP